MKIDDENRKDGDIEPSNEKFKKRILSQRDKLGKKYEKYELEIDSDIFSNDYLEIKTESWELFKKTGNVFIEYAAKYPNKNDFIPSGIRTTKSPVWVISFKDENGLIRTGIHCFYTDHILRTIETGLSEGWVKDITTGVLKETGDINKGYLVPIIKLMEDVYYSISDNIKEELDIKRLQVKLEYNPTEEMRNNRLKELYKDKKK